MAETTQALEVDGCLAANADYLSYHRRRIEVTLKKLKETGARRIVELGSHPWAMTAALIDDADFELCAAVSADEILHWPDGIEVKKSCCRLKTSSGQIADFNTYSANLERTLFDLDLDVDAVLACEIIEHLLRSPHVLLLNANRWLPVGGLLLITTPNGAQFTNPFRRQTVSPSYRSHIYQRHHYLYTLDQLVELVELCGFQTVEAAFWNVYPLTGRSRIFSLLSRLPGTYFPEKFSRTLFLLARKRQSVKQLPRCPSVYDPRGEWEWIGER